MIFLDGVGIGLKDSENNPFFRYRSRVFSEVFPSVPSRENMYLNSNGAYLFPVDPVMGVRGLPQSGTGQTSIFCGVNAQQFLGQHFGPFPHSQLIPVIEKDNIFRSFMDSGRTVCFANAYPRVFFDYIKSGKKRLSVTSLSCRLSGVKLNKSTDLRAGKALSAEIDNSRWAEKLGYSIPVISPELAARRLLRLSQKHHFTLYEYFLTDHLGHGRLKDQLVSMLDVLDRFLLYIFRNLDHSNTTLVICSDHGNLEDLSVKTHTLNPALTITAGEHGGELAGKIKTLADIKPSIMRLYG